jgi:hypothetical protein
MKIRHLAAINMCLANGILRSRNFLLWLFATVMRIRCLCGMAALTFGIALMGARSLPAQTNCQAVNDAMNKIYTTPTHLYNIMDGNRKSEFIYVGGIIYDNFRGKWARSRTTLQQVMKMEEENGRNSKTTCRYLRDESVNGETAAVYSTHAERSDEDLGQIKSDGQFWISKSKGLPLRHEEDIDAGGGAKNHHSTRYEYTNVKPPL